MDRSLSRLSGRGRSRARFLLATVSLVAVGWVTTSRVQADTFTVTTTAADDSVGSLRWAINQANLAPGRADTIAFDASLSGSTLTLGQNLPMITKTGSSLVVEGLGRDQLTIDGNDQAAAFFVESGDVTIRGLTITGSHAQGGDGGQGGGGGGLGAGGGLFVNQGANVTVENVNFAENSAKGGNGGASDTNYGGINGIGGGGGGGFRGDGGAGVGSGGGGGGGFEGNGGWSDYAGGGGGGLAGNGANGNFYTGGGGGGSGSLDVGLTGQAGISVGSGGAAGGNGVMLNELVDATAGGIGGGGGGGGVPSGQGGAGGLYGGGGGGGSTDFIYSNNNNNVLTSGSGGQAGDFGGGGGGSSSSGIYYNTSPGHGGAGGFGGGGGGAASSSYGYGGGLGYGATGGAGGFGAGDGSSGSNGYYDPIFGGGGGGGGGGDGLGGAIFVRSGGTLTVKNVSIGGGNVTAGTGAGGNGYYGFPFYDPFYNSTGNNGVAQGSGLYLMSGVDTTANVAASTSETIADGIAGAGGLTKTGDGTLNLTGTNSYTGGTTVSAGTLVGNTNSLQGNITNNSQLVFDQDNNGTYSGILSGTGDLTKTGSGVVGITATSFSTGATTVTGGRLAIDDQSNLGSGDVTLDGGGLRFNQEVGLGRDVVLGANGGTIELDNYNGSLDGQISGTGPLHLAGIGHHQQTLFLTGGATTYTGGTTVDNLIVSGDTQSIHGDYTLNADGAVLFNQNTDGTYAGIASDIGSLHKVGAGNVTLTGANTYTGGTVIDNGTLTGTTSSIQGNITNNSQLVLNQSTTGTFSGAIDGSGALTKSGTGTVKLTGTNSYTGGTTVSGGTLVGNTSSLRGDITNNSKLTFDQATNGTYAGSLSGNGALTKTGTGTVELTGTQTSTGGTNITGGRLAISGQANLGSGNVTLNGGSLNFRQNVALGQNVAVGADGGTIELGDHTSSSLNGSVSGAGALNLVGVGPHTPTLTLNGSASNHTGGTTVENLNVSGNTQSVRGNYALNSGSRLEFNQSTNGTYAGIASGIGSLHKSGTGTVTLSGTNTYTGGTVINGGNLVGTTDSLQGEITNNSQLTFDQVNDGSFLGSISGTGSLTKNGDGVVTLTGTNSYTGGTVVNGGRLIGDATSLQGGISNSGDVVFDQTGNETYANVISGTGSFTKTGSGSISLTGANTYTGGTTVDQGRLAVNGTVVGDVTVNQDGTLGGRGTIGGNVTSTGHLAAGNSIDTLNIVGNTTINGGTVDVEIDDQGTVPGINNDLIAVGGVTTINGGTVNVQGGAGTYTDRTRYTFLTSGGGVNGRFAGSTDDLAFFDAVLFYDANAVGFQLVDNSQTFAGLALNRNQLAVGTNLDGLRTTATGDMSDIIDQLRLMTDPQVQAGLNQLGGQIYATLATSQLQHTSHNVSTMRNQLSLSSPCDFGGKTSGWLSGYGIGGQGNSDTYGASGFDYRVGGTEFAVQRCVGDGVSVGGFGNFGYSDVKLEDVAERGQVNSYLFGLTLQHVGDYGYQIAILGGGFQDINATRNINTGNLQRQAKSDSSGNQALAYLEQGTTIERGGFLFRPYVSVQYVGVQQNGFQETGAGAASLNGTRLEADSLRQYVGLSAGKTIERTWGLITPTVHAALMHEYLDTAQTFGASFSGAPAGSNFAIHGVDLGRDWAVTGLGVNTTLTSRINLFLNYNNQFNGDQFFHTGSGGLQTSW